MRKRTKERGNPADRAIRELRQAVAHIQEEGGPWDRVLRKRAEALLARLRDVPVAMLVADNRGRYVDVNAAAVFLTGYSRGELLRRSVWDLTPAAQQARGLALWRAFLARGQMSGTYSLRRKSGRVVTARYFAATNVLPGLHVSALATVPLIKRLRAPARASAQARKWLNCGAIDASPRESRRRGDPGRSV